MTVPDPTPSPPGDYGFVDAHGTPHPATRDELAAACRAGPIPRLVWTPDSGGPVPPEEVPFLLEAIRARIGGGAKAQAIIVGVFASVLAFQNLDALRPGSPGAVYLLFGVIWIALRLREWRQASVMTPQGFRDMMREAEQTAALRRVPVVYLRLLAGMIAAVGAAQLLASGSGIPNYGIAPAEMAPEYIRAGETWRLLTAGYLHSGMIHFAVNFMALLALGRETEVLAHRAYLAIVFLAAVLGGSLASFIVPPDVPSVGSSGGLMGLIGFLGVLAYRRRETVPPGFLKMVLLNVAVIAGIGIVGMGMIDNAAHAGGLAVGALLGALLVPTTRAHPRWVAGPAVHAAGIAAMIVLALGCAWTLVLVLLPVL
jgi:membrane associated rhomboid family serine protease